MLETFHSMLLILGTFTVVALASQQIGRHVARLRLPLITGFLFAGILVGPYVLGLITESAIEQLTVINEISLAFIAFAAGSELYLKELRHHVRHIGWVTGMNALVVPALGSLGVFAFSRFIPFMTAMTTTERIAVSALAGAILVARSPSSAIAIVDELRAKGPFTQMTLGVTMVTDVVVIMLFAISAEMAGALLERVPVSLAFVGLLLAELFLSFLFGYLVGRVLYSILWLRARRGIKSFLILLVGYAVFLASHFIRENSEAFISIELLLEPLLIAMVASFYVTNYTGYRDEFLSIISRLAPTVYIAFFTLTGAALALDILVNTWQVGLLIFIIRLIAVFIASFSGGAVAGAPFQQNLFGWMGYITMAGVSLGLATEVAVEFPQWGEQLATLVISVIVLTQLVGPPLYKWAITHVGESHARAAPSQFDGIRDAIIFGGDDQTLLLAQQLRSHHWQVKVATLDKAFLKSANISNVQIQHIGELSFQTLCDLDAPKADAIVGMLSDEENYHICELVYEHVGTETLVVRLHDHMQAERFHQLGALIVEPGTALVSLLDHFVRSPASTSLLLGMDENQDVIELELRNPVLHGISLRELRLPLDTLVLSVRREEHTIVSHGYTRLELGDHVTLVGSPESLENVMYRFDAPSPDSTPFE